MGAVTNREDKVYISDRGKGQVWQFNKNGKFLKTWPISGQDYKSQMAVDTHKRFYVTTFQNTTPITYTPPGEEAPQQYSTKVQCFTEDGYGVILDWRDEAGRPVQTGLPIAIAAGHGPYVYLGDSHNNRVRKFEYEPPGPGGKE